MRDPEPCRIKHTEDTEEQTELMEENEESEELSEVEEINHDKPGEKPLMLLKKTRAKKSFTCTQCGKSFPYQKHLEIHMRVHTGERLFTCDQCGKSFRGKQSLEIHMRAHTGEKLFMCVQCGRSFTIKKTSSPTHVDPHWRKATRM
ncbi:oocyte zinc finger protein XlCOF6-like [Cyprinus carpio]|uniref:Oocyte zinc finger protein XlCOF6-like n=1 Tax=Cyprinus carpio TaxID=7962 RepID=A0A9Q9W806_CYPCA|nr:oocyte zinc finger protein XlCOF6-like [Cyprinus carpio]